MFSVWTFALNKDLDHVIDIYMNLYRKQSKAKLLLNTLYENNWHNPNNTVTMAVNYVSIVGKESNISQYGMHETLSFSLLMAYSILI